VEADALLGGAIRFEGEMLDPPMFGKALQKPAARARPAVAVRAGHAVRPGDPKKLPVRVIRENWPYGVVV